MGKKPLSQAMRTAHDIVRREKQYPTTTVGELIDALSALPRDRPVRVWLPGSTIALSGVIPDYRGAAHIEGNVDPGSALDRD